MVVEPLKPSVPTLQRDTIDLLKQIAALMGRASTALGPDSGGEKYAAFQREVTKAARNVEDLALKMAIVAPMKAGKSTIINAIIGQEILPSRNAAMTTIPTEIIFDASQTEPLLTISREIQTVFQKAFFSLQGKIHQLGKERVQEKIAQYPHLATLASEIQAKTGGSIAEKIAGCQRVNNHLAALNDIVRLCSLLDPLADPLQYLTDVPRIYTPFWRAHKSAQTNLLGNLVIVDTPGPNEAGENLRLVNVVSEQLQNSSLVLLVLDFTQLRTEAAEKVRQDVQRVIELRGKENLYVLINKIDQRRKGDMTSAQVQQFVAAELGVGDSSDTNRVFEVSARWAFSAANFMQELQQHSNISIADMKTAPALAQEVFGIDWEEELVDATIEELEKKAEKLWKKSGFAPFLDRVIGALMEEAAPRCIMSALNIAYGRLSGLRDDVLLRSRAIGEDEKKLRFELGSLESDVEQLESCRKHLREVELIREQLQQNLKEILEALKKEAKVNLETYFLKEEYQRVAADNTISSQIRKIDIEGRQLFLKNIESFEMFPKWIAQRIKSTVEYKSSEILEFNSYEEAQEFTDLAATYAKQRAENLLENVRARTNEKIEEAHLKLTKLLDEASKSIIENARKRLNETFKVELSLPPIALTTKAPMDALDPQVMRQTKQVTEYQPKKYRPFYYLWLIEVEKEVPITRKEEYYIVSVETVVEQVNQSIEESITSIDWEVNKYLDEDFKRRIDTFFENLEHYLINYRDSLMQAQQAQMLSLDQKESLVRELESLVVDVIETLKKATLYLEYTKDLMGSK
jgi:GTPase SAR1 family protein